MSLYLTIFDGDVEVDGWVLGHYSDFGAFRNVISEECEDARSRYPTLLLHSDSDGEWTPEQLPALNAELHEIARHLQRLPPRPIEEAFEHTSEFRVRAQSLYDCFHNVDGTNLIEALISLCEKAERLQLPILFQ